MIWLPLLWVNVCAILVSINWGSRTKQMQMNFWTDCRWPSISISGLPHLLQIAIHSSWLHWNKRCEEWKAPIEQMRWMNWQHEFQLVRAENHEKHYMSMTHTQNSLYSLEGLHSLERLAKCSSSFKIKSYLFVILGNISVIMVWFKL